MAVVGCGHACATPTNRNSVSPTCTAVANHVTRLPCTFTASGITLYLPSIRLHAEPKGAAKPKRERTLTFLYPEGLAVKAGQWPCHLIATIVALTRRIIVYMSEDAISRHLPPLVTSSSLWQ